MPIRHITARAFWRAYEELPKSIQRQADKQFSLLKDNPYHPSLQFKKIIDRHGEQLWSARVSQDYRALALRQSSRYLWIWIGDHKTYDALISAH